MALAIFLAILATIYALIVFYAGGQILDQDPFDKLNMFVFANMVVLGFVIIAITIVALSLVK